MFHIHCLEIYAIISVNQKPGWWKKEENPRTEHQSPKRFMPQNRHEYLMGTFFCSPKPEKI